MSATFSPSTRPATRHRARTARRRSAAVILATLAMLAALLVPLDFAREIASRALYQLADGWFGSVPVAMAVAGWCTFGLLPLVAITIDDDHRRRYGSPDVGAPADSAQLIRRVRANGGHRVARRSVFYWVTRSPLALILGLALCFLPVPGANHKLVTTMAETHGGAAFLIGWQWGCVAGVLGAMIVIMAPVAAAVFRRPQQRSPAGGYFVAIALSVAALGVAVVSA